MGRGFAIAALCVGCYAPTFAPGTPCETECPGDLICIDRVCREPGYMPPMPPTDGAVNDTTMITIDASTIDGPPGDVDADGVLDNTDNCPSLANADQHNEDGDPTGDVCDYCPHLAGNAADTDGDKVGDACDPQPTIAKQRILFFDSFATARSEWSLYAGASRVGETLRINAVSGSAGDARLNVPTGETRTYLAGTIPSIVASSVHQLSVSFGPNQAGDVYHYVEFYDTGTSGGGVTITERDGSEYTELQEVNYAGALPTGAWSMRIDESVAQQQFTFLAKLGGVDYAQIAASVATAPAHVTGNRIAFYVRGADIRIDYCLVIETMP